MGSWPRVSEKLGCSVPARCLPWQGQPGAGPSAASWLRHLPSQAWPGWWQRSHVPARPLWRSTGLQVGITGVPKSGQAAAASTGDTEQAGPPQPEQPGPASPKPFTWVCPCPTAPGRASGWCKYLYHHPRRAGGAGMLLCPPAGVKLQREKPLLGNVVALRLMPRASAVHKGGSANKMEPRGRLPHHEPETPLPYQSLALVPALPTDPSGVPLPRASPGPSPAHRSVGLGSIQKPCADFILSLTEL